MKTDLQSPFLDAEFGVGMAGAAPPWLPLNLDSPYVQAERVSEALLEEEKGVIDGEDRKPVANPLALPFRWICSIAVVREITHASGRTSRTGLAPAGSGVLISPRHVLTAAHVLKSVRRDSSGSVSERHEAQTVHVKFGRDGSAAPLVEVEAERWDWPRKQWKPEAENSAFDFALITLKKPVGEQVFKALGNQALSWWGGAPKTSLGNLPSALASRLLGARVFTAGYPDSSNGQMMCAAGVLSTGSTANDAALSTPAAVEQWARNSALFSMTADATEGQSGSPVWVLDQGRRCIVGIVVTAGDSFNQVRGINPYLMRCIDGWTGKAAASHELIDELDDEGLELASELESEAADEAENDHDHEAEEDFAPEWEAPQADAFEHDKSEVDQALTSKDWRGALRAAIAAGEHDENKLTNLLFFARHPALDPTRPLQPKTSKEDAKLASEWSAIQRDEVWPAIEAAAEDPVLAVHGKQVASPLQHFRGAAGRRFKQLVETAAQQVDLNPGLLAAALIGETGTVADYLTASRVGSYRTGVDDFYAMRGILAKNVPAYAQIGWDKKQKPTMHLNDAQKNRREVQSIWFNSGADALLATAVYLKYAEVRLRSDAVELGGNFDALPVETRFALIRMSMAAGRAGARTRLVRALKGQDILVRNFEPPVIYHTDRNATIRAAEAMFLSGWVFGQPLAATPVAQPELESFEEFDDAELDAAKLDDDESEDGAGAFYREMDPERVEGVDNLDRGAQDDEANDGFETRELDPVLLDIAERTMAREVPFVEHDVPVRWTTCFSAADIDKVKKVYEDNATAAGANSGDRCSCIVMLNVALGQLLTLELKEHRARGTSDRRVQMANLTTETIEKAMQQLRQKGYAVGPTRMNFFDRRNRTAGTLKPERLKTSVQDKVLAASKTEGCWFAFGLSIMDGYHSVLLLVDHTANDAKIYWFDQLPNGLGADVTNSLDQRLTDKTQAFWQSVMDTKGKGYDTTIRLWQLRKPRKSS